MNDTTTRYIGIRHRVKQTKNNEARPTEICILTGTEVTVHEMGNETSELDFVRGHFPTKMRAVLDDDTLEGIWSHHVVWRELKKGEEFTRPEHLRKTEGKKNFEAQKIPASYDGFRTGDVVALMLGGSGHRLAFALTRVATEIGARVLRIPSFGLKIEREKLVRTIDEDASTLATLAKEQPGLFHEFTPRDRSVLRVREALSTRINAMKDRIACELRLRSQVIGRTFLTDAGGYPEGSIEEIYDREKANDVILQNLMKEEGRRNAELAVALETVDIYRELFKPITGVGPMIAARIIASVISIKQYATKHKLKAALGAHLLSDGTFPRRRGGETANWSPDGRQALFLLADQFNRRPDSEWGKKFLDIKHNFRMRHPDVVNVEVPVKDKETGKTSVKKVKRYTPGHIQRMAMWRSVTKFVEWLYREWNRLENDPTAKVQAPPITVRLVANDQATPAPKTETDVPTNMVHTPAAFEDEALALEGSIRDELDSPREASL